MYFEIFSKGNLIIRGRKWLGSIQFSHELNLAPTVTLTTAKFSGESSGTYRQLIRLKKRLRLTFAMS